MSRSGKSAAAAAMTKIVMEESTYTPMLRIIAADTSSMSDQPAWQWQQVNKTTGRAGAGDGISRGREEPPVEIVLHAGGVLRDGAARNASFGDARAVVAAKISSAARLTNAYAAHPLLAWTSFSSIAALLVGRGSDGGGVRVDIEGKYTYTYGFDTSGGGACVLFTPRVNP